jgi:hypothetical protein
LGLTAAALKPADSRPSPTEKPRPAFTQSFGMIVNERVIIAMQPIRQRNPAEDQARLVRNSFIRLFLFWHFFVYSRLGSIS